MNPAQAMGTFLRTWRAEWAGMSRRQLAIAVSGLLNGSKSVSPTIVREWEDGQPPKTTEELEALCQVMGRRGLKAWELDEFRRAVFAACAGRQYPELFDSEGFCQSRDLEGRAWDVWQRRGLPGRDPETPDVVTLVAATSLLRHAVADGPSPGEAGQHRAQCIALGYLRHALADRHSTAGRARQSGLDCAETVRHIEIHGLNRWLGELHVREPCLGAVTKLTFADRDRRGIWQLIDLSREAEARGVPGWPAIIVNYAVACTPCAGDVDDRRAIREMA